MSPKSSQNCDILSGTDSATKKEFLKAAGGNTNRFCKLLETVLW
jgi:hypothetical protein